MIWLSCTSQHASDNSCGVCFSPPPPLSCHLIAFLPERRSEGSEGVAATESKSTGKAYFERLRHIKMKLILHIAELGFGLFPVFCSFWGISCSQSLRKLCNPEACEDRTLNKLKNAWALVNLSCYSSFFVLFKS